MANKRVSTPTIILLRTFRLGIFIHHHQYDDDHLDIYDTVHPVVERRSLISQQHPGTPMHIHRAQNQFNVVALDAALNFTKLKQSS